MMMNLYKHPKHNFFYGLMLLLPLQMVAQVNLLSPDKKILFTLGSTTGQLHYSVRFNGAAVVESSALGITVNNVFFGNNASTGKTTFYKQNETYAYRGVHNRAVNFYNGAKTTVTSNNRSFIIEARVFNDGVAFRYSIPNSDSATVNQEQTVFTLPASAVLWSQNNVKYYEGRYSKKNIDTIKAGELMGPPVTFELANNTGYAAITEGGLTDFGGMSLKALGNNQLQSNLAGITKKKGVVETPWRIIEIGKDLNSLVNCDIIANVSPAYDKKLFPKGYETGWVKPGRGVWTWLANRGPVTLDNLKKFTDLAAQLGFEYNLVDEGWGAWKDSINHRDNWDMLKELVDYSAAKGVKIWVWKAYPDRKGIPGLKNAEARRSFFQKAKELGIVGLKIDFFDSEGQEIVDFYQAALKDAAEYELMIDFHGSNKPTGETRTYPNEMTREAVRGLENRPPYNPHNAIIPFTRYLAGHGDYTPVHFGDRLGEGTWSYAVATAIVFTSPFLCYGSDPQTILDNPAKELIQSIPPTWDETVVLPQSKIGELVLFARRKGTTWFLAVMNGVKEAKIITVDLSFLKKGNYNVSFIKDNSSVQAGGDLGTEKVTATSTVTLNLNPHGGYAARFTKL